YAYVALAERNDSPEAKREKLITNPIFSNVRALVENGVPRQAGFEYGARSPQEEIPNETVDQLIHIDELLIAEYQVIPEIVRGGKDYRAEKDKAGYRDVVQYIENDDFYRGLRQLHDRGKISDGRFINLLMEDAQWQAKFRTYDALDIHRLKVDGKGGFTPEHL